MSRLGDLKKAVSHLPQAAKDKANEAVMWGSSQGRMELINKIMVGDGVTYQEAVAMCTSSDDTVRKPYYSFMWKLADITVPGLLLTKAGRKQFRDSLPDDEKEYFDREVADLNIKKIIKSERKKQKKQKKGA